MLLPSIKSLFSHTHKGMPMFTNKQFIEDTIINGGATYWLERESFKGYVVSVFGRELVIPIDEFTRGNTVKHFVECAYNDGFNIVGSWLFEGQVYLDCCKQFDYLNEADNFARSNKQRAYYNISGAFVITMDTTIWLAEYVHGHFGDINSTHYKREFTNYFAACDWLKEHNQSWNTCHRISGFSLDTIENGYRQYGTTEHIYF